MNQLLNSPNKAQAGNNSGANIEQLLDFLKKTPPEQAKQQVERLVKERGLSQQELASYQQKAMNLAKMLGIK